MFPSEEKIREWLIKGYDMGATHVNVYLDSFFIIPDVIEVGDEDYFAHYTIPDAKQDTHPLKNQFFKDPDITYQGTFCVPDCPKNCKNSNIETLLYYYEEKK